MSKLRQKFAFVIGRNPGVLLTVTALAEFLFWRYKNGWKYCRRQYFGMDDHVFKITFNSVSFALSDLIINVTVNLSIKLDMTRRQILPAEKVRYIGEIDFIILLVL